MEAGDYSTTPTEGTAASNGSGQSPWAAHEAGATNPHPEYPVIGAFIGGFVFAKLLKKLRGGDD
jgi:hypothetical protein